MINFDHLIYVCICMKFNICNDFDQSLKQYSCLFSISH